MDMSSGLSVLLRGFDAWVIEAKPSCDTASRVLRALQHVARQRESASSRISSIPVLAREQQFGPMSTAPLQMPAFDLDAFVF